MTGKKIGGYLILVVAACCAATPIWTRRGICAGDGRASRPWPASYKVKPDETDRLTAADVVGPDGVVYPDWRYAGIPGGVPDVPVVARIEQFGGRGDDARDDSQALEAAAREAAQRKEGGAVLLGRGTYYLDRPVFIPWDGVVIRGRGADQTRLVFRYAAPQKGVRFFTPADGDTVGPDTPIEVHADPQGLRRLTLRSGGITLAERVRGPHWGGTFSLRVFGDQLLRRFGSGSCRLTAEAEWDGGRAAKTEITVRLDSSSDHQRGSRRWPTRGLAAIVFHGDGRSGRRWRLSKDGQRGDRFIELRAQPDWKPGDAIQVEAPATERWNRLVQNACQWGTYRCGQFRVERVQGRRVWLNQPLRISFPVADASWAEKIDPIRRCGVEDLTLLQTHQLWTCGILFDTAWECWVRGVKVIKAGRHPAYTRRSKWCEIRDCTFDDAWYHGGGGTAYVGWERSYDCLMQNVTTWRMRHAPCVQWSSSGNVIRKSTFHGSDAQWHAGWTNENLFEQCFVDAAGQWGSYGHGGWASPPEDKAHGPEGPRNVVYNCDIRGTRTGLWLGGMNENWLILYNRIQAGSGPGLVVRNHSFDHIVRGNVFVLLKPNQPAVRLATEDCVGIELVDNRVYGRNCRLADGPGRPLVQKNNSCYPPTDNPPPPRPPVQSIFQWQRAKR